MWLLMGCPPNIYVKEIKHVQIINLSKVVKANTKLSDQTNKGASQESKNKILTRQLDDKILIEKTWPGSKRTSTEKTEE
jgi:hypothetical protein